MITQKSIEVGDWKVSEVQAFMEALKKANFNCYFDQTPLVLVIEVDVAGDVAGGEVKCSDVKNVGIL